MGVHNSKVVEAPCYKPEGRAFKNQLGELIFFNLRSPSSHGRQFAYSPSNWNENQKQKTNVSGEQCMWMTSASLISRHGGILNFSQSQLGPWPLMGTALFYSSWLQTQRPWVRFPALPDFLSSSESWTGSTQPREDKWGAIWKKSSGSGLKSEINGREGSAALTMGHPSIHRSWHQISLTHGCRSVGIVRLRTKGHKGCLSVYLFKKLYFCGCLKALSMQPCYFLKVITWNGLAVVGWNKCNLHYNSPKLISKSDDQFSFFICIKV
jgi:hypothetical protein